LNGPFRKLKEAFSLKAVIDAGMNYEHPKPVLSPEKKKELMDATSLDTPRSTMRSIVGILTPYWTKSGPKEIMTASALLATSLFMTWYAVQVTVDFGNWQSGLMDTIQQLFQAMMVERPELISGVLDNYPALKDTITADPMLKEILLRYPDTTSILYDPQFRDLLQNTPDLVELLGKNPTLLDNLTNFQAELGNEIYNKPSVKTHLSHLATLCGADFLNNWGSAISQTFNSAADSVKHGGQLINDSAKKAIQSAWASKDLATIALKFTGMAIISYKSSQYLALRWRSWSTGYYTSKWLSSKAYSRLKDRFNNIDNPGQRIQEDPARFTAGAVSVLTGVMNSGMTLASFSGMLWGMGTLLGVPHGMFWAAAAYASGLTALTMGAGWKLPWIQRNQQWREADLRDSITKVHNNADLIAQNNSEDVEKQLIQDRFNPAMKNSVREIGTQVKLILVDATAGNLSIPIPYVAGAFAIASGTASMGTVQTLNYAFNRVTSSLSFIVNRFDQLSYLKATADRIHMMDQAIDAARYIEEEKRQALEPVKKAAPNLTQP
jgi:putative ATP-binding cassette transporter